LTGVFLPADFTWGDEPEQGVGYAWRGEHGLDVGVGAEGTRKGAQPKKLMLHTGVLAFTGVLVFTGVLIFFAAAMVARYFLKFLDRSGADPIRSDPDPTRSHKTAPNSTDLLTRESNLFATVTSLDPPISVP
jgi:hypothetical protein